MATYSQLNTDTTSGGDVVGPGSSTDDNLAAFDGATGKLLKDSGIASGDVVQSDNTLTEYAVVCGDTSSKNVQSIAGVGTSGQVLTSNGAGALPTFQNAAGGDVVGPGSSTDNALARWDGASGDSLQDSDVIVTDNGEMTNTSQPFFTAYLTSNANNVTGDGTQYYLGDTDVGAGMTTLVNQGSHFTTGASGGAYFTAPVDGNYQFNFYALIQDFSSSHTLSLQLVTTSDTLDYGNYAAGQPAGNFPASFSVAIPLSATDTVKFAISSGGSTKTLDVNGGADSRTYVSGFLVC